VPDTGLLAGHVAYCAGAGEDTTFDTALLERGLWVTTFDPTPRAIAHVRATMPNSPRFRFEPIGWWDSSTELRFYAPTNPAHVSHSALNLQRTGEYFIAPVAPVHVLARRLGDDDTVHLIKMDIEGAEYRVIDSLLEFGPLPEILCVEFDQPQPVRKTVAAVRRLQRAGFELNYIDRWNYTFTRRPREGKGTTDGRGMSDPAPMTLSVRNDPPHFGK
jgi:FkbM family methyltransferase